MTQLITDFQKIPKGEDHNCFGCSPSNPHGLRMDFFYADDSVHSRIRVPKHLCGWNDLAHGGVISTILDEIMSWTAIYMLQTFILTKKMSIEFLKPVRIETDLTANGIVVERTSDREALVEGFLYDDRQRLCARSKGEFALLSMRFAKKMGVVDDDGAKPFETIFAHRSKTMGMKKPEPPA